MLGVVFVRIAGVRGTRRAGFCAPGLFRPFALVRGRAAGIWSMRAGEVALAPFGRLRAEHAETLRNDAADVVRFLHNS
jgi:hypothetical protein